MRYASLLSLVLLASCTDSPQHRETLTQLAVAVKTGRAEKTSIPTTYEATGTVRARTTATIASKVMAYVQGVSVHTGDRVRAGQVLVMLDSRDLESNVQRAEAGRLEVQSAIPEADNAVAAAKANADLARVTFKRMEDLAAKKSISNQEFDEASARLKSALANYEMARSKRAQLDSRVAQAEQEVRAAGITRDYTRITAPFAGVVVTRTVEPGNMAVPGAPLLTIEQDGLYRLEVAVDESKLGFVTMGQTVPVTLDAAGQTVNGRVSEIVPYVDPGSRTYIAKLDLPPVPQLRSGMFARAAFRAGSHERLVVPSSAVIQRGQLQSVFVVEKGMAHTRLVTAGHRAGNTVEILSGLNAGEEVIVTVPEGLRDGGRVEVR